MSRKNSIIILFVSALLILGGLVYFYISSSNVPPEVTQTTTSPFGGALGTVTTGTGSQTPQTSQGGVVIKNLSKLIQVYKNPTSGSVFSLNKSGQNILRFVDRAVGNVYEYLPETQTGDVKRITNTTIPKIQEVVWSNLGTDLILRYLDGSTDSINSFSAKIKSSTSSADLVQELTGSFLPPNIKQMAINPAGNKIFSLVDKSDRSGSYGYITNLDGSGKKIIFESPISYFNVSWPKENVVALTTKPNYKDIGLLYFFNTQTYSLDRVLGNMTGLSTLVNKDANLVAYSISMDNTFYLNVYDAINKISKDLVINTLADKCVWGNSNPEILYCAIPKAIIPDNYPDVWYQGTMSFVDDIWKMDTKTGNLQQVYQVGLEENVDIDAFDLKISLDDKYLSFSNKNDLSLWLLKLGQ